MYQCLHVCYLLGIEDMNYHFNEIPHRTSIWSGLDLLYLLLEKKWSTSVIPFGKNTLGFWQPQRRKNNSSYLDPCTHMSGCVLWEWQLLQRYLFNNLNHWMQDRRNIMFYHSPALAFVCGTPLVPCGIKVTFTTCTLAQCTWLITMLTHWDRVRQ